MEVGPFRMDPLNPGNLKLLERGGWEEFSGIVFGSSPSLLLSSTVIYRRWTADVEQPLDSRRLGCAVDQPPGTGLSYAPTDGYVQELGQASDHLVRFLANFYQVFPEWSGVDVSLRSSRCICLLERGTS